MKDKKLKHSADLRQVFHYLTRVFCACCLTFGVQADEYAELDFIGFSNDGKYLAFEEFGRTYDQNGKQESFSIINVIDVVNNQHESNPLRKTIPDSNRSFLLQTRQETMQAAMKILKKREIQTAQSPHGLQHLVHHPLSDLSADPHQVRFSTSVFTLISDRYQLDLTEQAVKQTCGPNNLNPRIFTLTLSAETGAQQILQQDSRLPNSRGCVTAYRIQDVYLYQKLYIAVFLNVFQSTAHGESVRHMVVTGKLKAALKNQQGQ